MPSSASPPTHIYTLSLHDALPIFPDIGASTNLKVSSLTLKEFVTHLVPRSVVESMATNEILQIVVFSVFFGIAASALGEKARTVVRSEEHTSELQSRFDLVCRLLLRPPPTSTLFPYTTLFRSSPTSAHRPTSRSARSRSRNS